MAMFSGRTTPEGIIALVMEEVDRLGGLAKAFPNDGQIQLYSGPNVKFMNQLAGIKKKNQTRALKQIRELSWRAVILDNTPIGRYLFVENDLYGWLRSVHTELRAADKDELIDSEAKQIISFVSALFMRAAKGHVKTAVCGAERGRIFYQTEIPCLCDRANVPSQAKKLIEELLDNKDIESVNLVPIRVFRALYARKGLEEVYDRICLSELRERWLYAYNTRKASDYADYLDRLELYRLDKQERLWSNAPLSARPEIYRELARSRTKRILARRQRLRIFRAAVAAMTSPASAAQSQVSHLVAPCLLPPLAARRKRPTFTPAG